MFSPTPADRRSFPAMQTRWIWSALALGLIALPTTLALTVLRPAEAPAESGPPKLAVLVYFDQLRGDYLTRWDGLYCDGGFHRLEKEGVWFQDCHYPYANTVTGAGHASVAAGCSPDTHGILGNEWYDRAAAAEVNCVEDDRYPRVPPAPKEEPKKPDEKSDESSKKKKYTGVSPKRLLAPTLGDALKEATGGKGRVVSLSFKDRGALLPGGQHPDACYWFDTADGLFVTSEYYRSAPHRWVADYNAGRPAERWLGKEWTRLKPGLDYARYSGPDDAPGEGKGASQGVTFPHPFDGGPKKKKSVYFNQLYNSPFGNEMLLELAGRAVDAEQLGRHDEPDLLCLSFSCNDPIGHVWGPDSQEVLDVTLRTDLIVKDLLAMLDAKVGKGRYVLALTADHGVCPLPEASKARGKDAGREPDDLLKKKANAFLVEKFGGDSKTLYVVEAAHPWVYLNHGLLKAKGLKAEEVAEALAKWLAGRKGIQAAYTHAQLAEGVASDDEIGQMMRRSFVADRAGDVGVVNRPYWIVYGSTGTTHGSPNDYDTHVPLLVYGPGVAGGARRDRVTPQAAAAILARALGIKAPAKAEAPVTEGVFGK
jgi:predicted AlkP superfamily pyrophosphatase or phosphodiesterase